MANTMKKLLSLVIALVMVLSLIPAVTAAESETTYSAPAEPTDYDLIEISTVDEWLEWFDNKGDSKILTQAKANNKTQYVKLLESITISDNDAVFYVGSAAETHIYLDLGGKTITYTAPSKASARLFGMYYETSSFTVVNGNIVSDAEISGANGGLFFSTKGIITLYNVNVTDTSTHAFPNQGELISISGATTFTATNCSFTANTANNANSDSTKHTEFGGLISSSASMTLNNCTLTTVNGENANGIERGGIIYASGGALNLNDCTLTGGRADAGNGGSVYVIGSTTVNLNGGSITGGEAMRGGNLYVIAGGSGTTEKPYTYATVNIDGTEISGGVAVGPNGDDGTAGNVYISGGRVNMYSGIIGEGTTTKTAPYLYANSSGVADADGNTDMFHMYGGTLYGLVGGEDKIILHSGYSPNNLGERLGACSTISEEKNADGYYVITHNNTDGKDNDSATCDTAGNVVVACEDCNYTYTYQVEENHTVVADVAVDATCTESGLTAGSHCSDCGDVLVAQETVAALGHSEPVYNNDGDTHSVDYPCCDALDAAGLTHTYENGVCVCTAEEPVIMDYTGTYYIAAIRPGEDSTVQYMTSDLGTADTKRYQAEDSALTALPAEITSGVEDNVFTLIQNWDGTYNILAGNGQYLSWTAGDSAELSDTPVDFTVTKLESGLFNISLAASETETRTLALDAQEGNNYFAFYTSAQVNDLALILVTGDIHYHNYVAGERVSPNCTETGTQAYACECGDSYTEVLKALGHMPSDMDKGDGTHYSICCICWEPLGEPTGHVFVDGVCSCNVVQTVKVYFRNDRNWTDVNMYYWFADESYDYAWPGVGMDYYGYDGSYDIYVWNLPVTVAGVLFNGNDATAQTPDITSGWCDGICYYMTADNQIGSCNISQITLQCKHVEEPVPGKPANCTEPGLTEGKYCSVCQTMTVEQEEIPATGHTWNEVYNEETKVFDRTCSVCSTSETREVKALEITEDLSDTLEADVNEQKTLTVAAQGEGELTYLWLYNRPGTEKWYYWAEPAANKTAIDVKATVARDGYSFKCIITDAYGNKAETAVLTLDVLADDEIVITEQPVSLSVTAGDGVAISVNATVQGTATYLWQYKRSDSTSWYYWSNPGEENSITFTATMARNGYSFRCVISNDNGASKTTDVVTLEVTSALTGSDVAPSVENGQFTLTAEVDGTDLTYLWLYQRPSMVENDAWYYWKEPGDYSTITGSTAGRDGYRFKCVIADANGSEVTTAIYELKNGVLEEVKASEEA